MKPEPSKLPAKNPTTKNYIDNKSAKAFILKIFECISSASTAAELKEIPETCSLGTELKKKMPGKKFPRLEIHITPKQLQKLKETKVILSDNRFSTELASGKSSEGYELNDLEKLLYSMLWKQGDLGKERHIVSGIFENDRDKNQGPVFHEFGRYLAKKNDYIIDQHTLRFFAVLNSSKDDIETARKLKAVDFARKDHLALECSYKEFYAILSKKELGKKEKADFNYEVDRLLFGAGALVKI